MLIRANAKKHPDSQSFAWHQGLAGFGSLVKVLNRKESRKVLLGIPNERISGSKACNILARHLKIIFAKSIIF